LSSYRSRCGGDGPFSHHGERRNLGRRVGGGGAEPGAVDWGRGKSGSSGCLAGEEGTLHI